MVGERFALEANSAEPGPRQWCGIFVALEQLPGGDALSVVDLQTLPKEKSCLVVERFANYGECSKRLTSMYLKSRIILGNFFLPLFLKVKIFLNSL